MRFLSCFSGIEAASVAWTPLGWQCVGVAEVEPFPCAVLAHHYPDVPNLGDVTADDFLQRASALRPDVLVGGPPCQDFSVAGLRAGLAGDRGNLSLRWVEIVRAIRPAFAVTENVPGWLSVNKGHAFGAFLAGLVGHDTALVPPRQCGGWTNAGMVDGPDGRVAWRILDAQHFGLAQRRKRVFAVFCPRDGADPAAVLFERQGVHRDSPPRREAGEGTTGTLSSRASAGGGLGTDFECGGGVVAPTFLHCNKGRPDGRKSAHTEMVTLEDIVPTLATDGHAQSAVAIPLQEISKRTGVSTDDPRAGIGIGQDGDPMFTLQAGAQHGIAVAFDARQSDVIQYGDQSGPLDTDGHSVAVAFQDRFRGDDGRGYDRPPPVSTEQAGTLETVGMPAGTLTSNGDAHSGFKDEHELVGGHAAVRRLTPEECEALQGFPRLYTRIPYGKKGKGSGWSADGPRYRALGNSMAVPCMAWIGRRIAAQEAKAQQVAA